MQATSFLSSSSSSAVTFLRRPSTLPFSPLLPRGKKPSVLAMAASSSSSDRGSSSNSNKGRDFGGRLVDENMIVLRMRIQETKLLEASDEPPAHWMEWEQNYYQDYIQDVLQAMGLLQNYLMHVRPCLTLGMIAIVTFTVLLSSGVALFQALHVAHMIISSGHFS